MYMYIYICIRTYVYVLIHIAMYRNIIAKPLIYMHLIISSLKQSREVSTPVTYEETEAYSG